MVEKIKNGKKTITFLGTIDFFGAVINLIIISGIVLGYFKADPVPGLMLLTGGFISNGILIVESYGLLKMRTWGYTLALFYGVMQSGMYIIRSFSQSNPVYYAWILYFIVKSAALYINREVFSKEKKISF